MATEEEVKSYLAYWFQVGKNVEIGTNREKKNVNKIFSLSSNEYSQEFNSLWEKIVEEADTSFLEDTSFSIKKLLSSEIEIVACSVCNAIVASGIFFTNNSCICSNIPLWPNLDIPQPKKLLDSNCALLKIVQKLMEEKSENMDSRHKTY